MADEVREHYRLASDRVVTVYAGLVESRGWRVKARRSAVAARRGALRARAPMTGACLAPDGSLPEATIATNTHARTRTATAKAPGSRARVSNRRPGSG